MRPRVLVVGDLQISFAAGHSKPKTEATGTTPVEPLGSPIDPGRGRVPAAHVTVSLSSIAGGRPSLSPIAGKPGVPHFGMTTLSFGYFFFMNFRAMNVWQWETSGFSRVGQLHPI